MHRPTAPHFSHHLTSAHVLTLLTLFPPPSPQAKAIEEAVTSACLRSGLEALRRRLAARRAANDRLRRQMAGVSVTYVRGGRPLDLLGLGLGMGRAAAAGVGGGAMAGGGGGGGGQRGSQAVSRGARVVVGGHRG